MVAGEIDGTKSEGPVHPFKASEYVPGLPVVAKSRLPSRWPFAVGAKATWIEQLSFSFNVLPQLFVWLKSPLVVRLVSASGALPPLEM